MSRLKKIFWLDFLIIVIIIGYLLLLFEFKTYKVFAEEDYYDLEAVEMSVSPIQPEKNEACTISVKIKNSGNQNLTSGTGIKIFNHFFNDFNVSTSDITYNIPSVSNPVAPNEYVTYVFSGKFIEEGVKNLKFDADFYNHLEEKNENNNSVTKQITVLEETIEYYNDLEAVQISVEPAEPIVKQNCTLSVAVKNNGNKNITSTQGLNNYSYDIQDFTLISLNYTQPTPSNPVKPNGYIIYTIKGSFNKIGTKSASFNVNINNSLSETNTNNNSVSRQINVEEEEEESYYDLEATQISINPEKPQIEQNCVITVKIQNKSNQNLFSNTGLTSFNYIFPDFNKTKLNYAAPSMNNVVTPNEYIIYIFEGRFNKAGQKNLSFNIDAGDFLQESNEENNSITKDITVLEQNQTDIGIESIKINPEEIIVGDAITISLKIKNLGPSSLISGNGLTKDDLLYQISYFQVESITSDEYPTLTNPLAPQKIFNYELKGSFTKNMTGNLSFKINKNNSLTESNTDNNSKTIPIIVYKNQTEADDFTITNIEVLLISSSTVRIQWNTSKKTTGQIECWQNSLKQTKKISQANTTHSVEITDLLAGKTYSYIILAVKNTVEKTSETSQFTVPKNNSIAIVSQEQPIINHSTKEVTIKWTTDIAANSYVYYKKHIDNNYKSKGSEELANYHEVIIENLAEDKYDYYIKSIGKEQTSAQSEALNFTIIKTIEDSSSLPTTKDNSNGNDSESNTFYNNVLNIKNQKLYKQLTGKIILKVEASGEAYYIHPQKETMYYLGRPSDAFQVMREQGVGITNINLEKIPVGLSNLSGADTDGDGLPDMFEDAVGTDKNKKDTDSDSYNDKTELENGYKPNGSGKLSFDNNFTNNQKGKIFLQVERNGEAWYINPSNGKRYFLGRPADAFSVMRNLGLGISNNDFEKL